MKKPLLFSAFLIIAGTAFAQLTVKPTASNTDSYVYVKDQILYVENDINLTQNPTATVQASIYLRDNGQLIQGGTTSSNTGNGFLSVQQNTDPTNAYAYYYWASPVGNPTIAPTVGNTNFGLGSIYEPMSGALGTNARISENIASKEGHTFPELTISRRWMYIHEDPGTEAEGNYHRINADNLVPAGFGFTMKGVNEGNLGAPNPTGPNFGHDQVYEFRGRPNSGDFTITVGGPVGTHPDVDAKMTLSGNPYPSALDLNKVFYEPGNNELSAFYYYDENRSVMSHYYSQKPFGYGVWIPNGQDPYTGGVPDYATYPGSYTQAAFSIWNAGGNQTGPGSGVGGNDDNKRFAPIGQGIMFVGKANGDVTIKNSHRIFIKEGDPGSVFQRPNGDSYNETTTQNDARGNLNGDINAEVIDTRIPQLRLYVVFDEALTRDMLLLLTDQATDGYDRGYDGLSPGGMKTDAFFPIENNNQTLPYVIQGTNYDVNKQIPITFNIDQPSIVNVRAVEQINVPYERAYLYDKQENTYRELFINDEAGFSLPTGLYENRFFIVFRNPNLRSDVPEDEMLANEAVRKSINFFQNNPAQHLEVGNPDGYTLKSAAVYDMAGKLVIHEKNLGDETKYSFYTGNLSDGVYLIKLTTSEDLIIDYKAIVHNK